MLWHWCSRRDLSRIGQPILVSMFHTDGHRLGGAAGSRERGCVLSTEDGRVSSCECGEFSVRTMHWEACEISSCLVCHIRPCIHSSAPSGAQELLRQGQ